MTTKELIKAGINSWKRSWEYEAKRHDRVLDVEFGLEEEEFTIVAPETYDPGFINSTMRPGDKRYEARCFVWVSFNKGSRHVIFKQEVSKHGILDKLWDRIAMEMINAGFHFSYQGYVDRRRNEDSGYIKASEEPLSWRYPKTPKDAFQHTLRSKTERPGTS